MADDTDLYAFSLPHLPEDCKHIYGQVARLRRRLVDAVKARHGHYCPVTHDRAVNAACTAECHRLLSSYWLRTCYGELSAADKRQFSRDTMAAAESRNRALAALELDAGEQASGLASLFAEGDDDETE